MKLSDFGFIGLLAALAVFIWVRDMTWVSTSDDTLPILVALPLFVWLEWPWEFKENDFRLSETYVLSASLLFIAGVLSSLTILLTLGWCLLLWSWLEQRVTDRYRSRLVKLMILPLMAFPWITLDAYTVGWWFRLSGAWATTQFYSLIGLNAVQDGTTIILNGLPIAVDVSCAGLNTLQSMLIAGSVLAYIQLGHLNRYWINLPFLAFMAWLANTLRIIMLCGVAVGVSTEFAMGPFHESGGWVVLFLMFCLCYALFTAQRPKNEPVEG
jgi:exosortase